MKICLDFLEWLGADTSSSVFMLLDDPADLVRVSAVSRSWRRFVIANGFCKNFCLRICSETSHFKRLVEISRLKTSEVGCTSGAEWMTLEREHRVYSYLSHCIFAPVGKRDCILESICASSTDNFPGESIENTLEPSTRGHMRPLYWSSEGQRDPGVPETLTYRLLSKLCVVNEIKIQPFEAYFQYENPIYSTKSVRFRMGYCRLLSSASTKKVGQDSADENYEWIYISPEFPMLQENTLQSFKLPCPVLCIGGILQIEFLGRIQVQEMDGLYYVCIRHVQVLGHPLTARLDVEFAEAGDEMMILKYLPEARGCSSPDAQDASRWDALRERINHLRARARRSWHYPFINTFLSAVESDSDDEPPQDDW